MQISGQITQKYSSGNIEFDYYHSGIILLLGRVIRQAIKDYKDEDLKRTSKAEWESARDFLYEPGHLEAFLRLFQIDDKLNVIWLRKYIQQDHFKYLRNDLDGCSRGITHGDY